MKKVGLLVFLAFFVLFTTQASALYQPWKAEQAAREAYNQKKATYSPPSQKKLDDLAGQIVEINQRRTDELAMQMEAQGVILEEFAFRNPNESGLEKTQDYLTYAHEAVAFQAAKNYVFSLSSEANIKRDVTPTVTQFKNDLSVLRKKVINSQAMVQKLITP